MIEDRRMRWHDDPEPKPQVKEGMSFPRVMVIVGILLAVVAVFGVVGVVNHQKTQNEIEQIDQTYDRWLKQ